MANWSQLERMVMEIDVKLRANVELSIFLRSTNVEEFLEKLDRVKSVIANNPARLGAAAMQAIQRLVVQRARNAAFPTPLLYQNGGSTTNSQTLQAGWEMVINTLQSFKVQTLGTDTVGFGSRSALDRIRLNRPEVMSRAFDQWQAGRREMGADADPKEYRGRRGPTSATQFDIVWQIAEFGTGRFAFPNKRTEADDPYTKVPGGGGAWYLSPKRKGPQIYGQEGTHFLFGLRNKALHDRENTQVATGAILAELNNLLNEDV